MRVGRLVLAVACLAPWVRPLAAQEPVDSAPPRRRIFPVPVLGYAPETSLMFGGAGVGVVAGPASPPTRPSTALATAVYTLRNQFQLGLDLDHWTAGDRWHLTGSVGAERYPSQFHGVGAAATDSSETYTPQHLTLAVAAQHRVAPHLYAGAGYWIRNTRMVKLDPLGRLAAGTVTGSAGATEASLTVDGVWAARDALYMTRRGGYLRLAIGVAGPALGGEHAWRRYTADARAYRAVGRAVLAAQAVLDATDGTVPFEQLPHLGGQNILRGYTGPRFLDGAMSAAQVEVRAPLKGIFWGVAFAGAGATAPRLGGVPDAPLRVAGGLGLRVVLDRANGLQLRIDYALAKGGGGLYVAAGDAF